MKEEVKKELFGNNNNFLYKPLFGGEDLFENLNNISLFGNLRGKEILCSKRKIVQKPLFISPIFIKNKIMGVLGGGEGEKITLELDFSQDIQIKNFIPSSAYCNSEGYL